MKCRNQIDIISICYEKLRAEYINTCGANNSALSLACPAQEFPEEQLHVGKDDFVAPCCLFIVTSHCAYMQLTSFNTCSTHGHSFHIFDEVLLTCANKTYCKSDFTRAIQGRSTYILLVRKCCFLCNDQKHKLNCLLAVLLRAIIT